ncbi:MAG: OsmC family protein [Pseudomonadota bacterium]
MTDTNGFRVGERGDAPPSPTQYEPGPFKKSRPPEPLRFEVNVAAEALDRQKKMGSVQVNIPGFSAVRLYCDEQTPVGDDTAPPPLAFFCAGIGFCLLTHLTDILTARKIEVTSLKLEQRVYFETNLGTMRELGHTTDGKCELVETHVHVLIESPESSERVGALLEEAEGACMAHFALRNVVPWSTRLIHNERQIHEHRGPAR